MAKKGIEIKTKSKEKTTQVTTLEQKKDYAKHLYIGDKAITQKELSLRTGVSEQTISKWIKLYEWDKIKNYSLFTKSEQLQNLYAQLEQINSTINNREDGKKYPSSSEADIISKLSKAIERLETETSIADKVEIGMLFISFVRSQSDLLKVQEIGALYNDFIKSVIN